MSRKKSTGVQIPKDDFHQTKDVNLFQQFLFILNQRRLGPQRCIMSTAQFLVTNKITKIKGLKDIEKPLNWCSQKTLYLLEQKFSDHSNNI